MEQTEMDAAAQVAEQELEQHLDQWSARELAAWWGRHYLKAGHKRLGRLLATRKEI